MHEHVEPMYGNSYTNTSLPYTMALYLPRSRYTIIGILLEPIIVLVGIPWSRYTLILLFHTPWHYTYHGVCIMWYPPRNSKAWHPRFSQDRGTPTLATGRPGQRPAPPARRKKTSPCLGLCDYGTSIIDQFPIRALGCLAGMPFLQTQGMQSCQAHRTGK